MFNHRDQYLKTEIRSTFFNIEIYCQFNTLKLLKTLFFKNLFIHLKQQTHDSTF